MLLVGGGVYVFERARGEVKAKRRDVSLELLPSVMTGRGVVLLGVVSLLSWKRMRERENTVPGK